jgi:hypothetical protein
MVFSLLDDSIDIIVKVKIIEIHALKLTEKSIFSILIQFPLQNDVVSHLPSMI